MQKAIRIKEKKIRRSEKLRVKEHHSPRDAEPHFGSELPPQFQ